MQTVFDGLNKYFFITINEDFYFPFVYDKFCFWFAALAVFKGKQLPLRLKVYFGNLLNNEFDIGGALKLLNNGFLEILLFTNIGGFFGVLSLAKKDVYMV